MTELRRGEVLVKTAGGKCLVCKGRIEAGEAIQVSAYSNSIRHLECLPKKDTRHDGRTTRKDVRDKYNS